MPAASNLSNNLSVAGTGLFMGVFTSYLSNSSFTNQTRGLLSEVVTVLVGPDKKLFYAHKALFSSKFTYFRATFEGSFKEAEDKSLHLVDEDPDCFAYYVLWIYNQPLEHISSNIERKPMLDDYCYLFVL
ncbi:MAG: hypothetical protein Q9225_005691, partial [Loekoesia sp. 1 TL-2023]